MAIAMRKNRRDGQADKDGIGRFFQTIHKMLHPKTVCLHACRDLRTIKGALPTSMSHKVRLDTPKSPSDDPVQFIFHMHQRSRMGGIQRVQSVYRRKHLSVMIPEQDILVVIISICAGNLLMKILSHDERAEIRSCALSISLHICHCLLHFVGKAVPKRVKIDILAAVFPAIRMF